jgi:hypothetical protein
MPKHDAKASFEIACLKKKEFFHLNGIHLHYDEF